MHNRRRIYWINPRSQGVYILRILLLELLVAAVCVPLTAFLTVFLLQINAGVEIANPTNYWLRIFGYVLGFCALAAAGLVYLGVRVSHRIYGPVYHFEKVFQQALAGQSVPREFQLRTRDEFHPLCLLINRYFDRQRERDELSAGGMRTLDEQLSRLDAALIADAGAGDGNLRAQFSKLRETLTDLQRQTSGE